MTETSVRNPEAPPDGWDPPAGVFGLGPGATFLLIAAFALTVRLIYFGGAVGSDDLSLAFRALEFLDEGPVIPQIHYDFRNGLIMPLAGIYALFGVGEWQLVILPLVLSIVGIFVAYELGRALVGAGAGLLAALVLAVFPLDVLAATTLYPDTPMGIALAAAVALVVRARDSGRADLWAVAAGLVWGYAYLIKIEGLIMGATFLALAAFDRRLRRPVLVAIVVFGAVVAVETAYYWMRTGELFFRLHITGTGASGYQVSKEFSATQLWVFPKSWFITLRLIPLAPVGSTGGGLDATRAAARSGYGPRKVRFRDQLPARQPTTA